MGTRDDEKFHEVPTEKRSGIGDHETVDLVGGIKVDETPPGGDRALENLARSLLAQSRDLTLKGECFETVEGGGEPDDASFWHEKP
jgi:hypothetical protein